MCFTFEHKIQQPKAHVFLYSAPKSQCQNSSNALLFSIYFGSSKYLPPSDHRQDQQWSNSLLLIQTKKLFSIRYFLAFRSLKTRSKAHVAFQRSRRMKPCPKPGESQISDLFSCGGLVKVQPSLTYICCLRLFFSRCQNQVARAHVLRNYFLQGDIALGHERSNRRTRFASRGLTFCIFIWLNTASVDASTSCSAIPKAKDREYMSSGRSSSSKFCKSIAAKAHVFCSLPATIKRTDHQKETWQPMNVEARLLLFRPPVKACLRKSHVLRLTSLTIFTWRSWWL